MSFFVSQDAKKRECPLCGEKKWISKTLGVCGDCIEHRFSEVKERLTEAHKEIRAPFSLPYPPPASKGEDVVSCNLCSNECKLAPGERSFCGLRENVDGQLRSLTTPQQGMLYAYRDPIPTNCCASWFCPAETDRGYPRYTKSRSIEDDHSNLAIFAGGCNFNCFFCQNSDHKWVDPKRAEVSAVPVTDLKERILEDERYTCICYFGGSPEPQFPFIFNLNRQILEEKGEDRICRICFEWNGAGNPKWVKKVTEQSLRSGGIVKFDLKAPDSKLSFALSGVKNEQVFHNFEMVYREFWEDRPEVPILTATTLLVPGYIGPEEVEKIATFIADLNEEIPYSLLIFHPAFKALDLPITPKKTAKESLERAKQHLENVNLGNRHLLSSAPPE